MKRRVLAGLVAALAVTGGVADAADPSGFFTVIGYSGVFPHFRTVPGISNPSYLDGVEAAAGWRFNRFYTLEASYDYDTASKNSGGTGTNVTLQAGSVDAMGYLPLGAGSSWSLYSDLGGSAFFLHGESASVSGGDETRFGGRAGAGVQYQISDDLGLRIGGRYEWMGFSNFKYGETVSVGLVWQK